MKGFTSTLFLLTIAALIALAGYLVITEKAVAPTIVGQSPQQATTTPSAEIVATSTQSTGLLQTCPEQWINNKMPTIVEPGQPRPVTQYFIYKGERRELAEFDMAWVSANCQIAPSVVY